MSDEGSQVKAMTSPTPVQILQLCLRSAGALVLPINAPKFARGTIALTLTPFIPSHTLS